MPPLNRFGVTTTDEVTLVGDLTMHGQDIINPDLVDGIDLEVLDARVVALESGVPPGGGIGDAPVDGFLYVRNGQTGLWETTLNDGKQYALQDGLFSEVVSGFVPLADADLDMANFNITGANRIEATTAAPLTLSADPGQLVVLENELDMSMLPIINSSGFLVDTADTTTAFKLTANELVGEAVMSNSLAVGCVGIREALMSYQAPPAIISGGTNDTTVQEIGQWMLCDWLEVDATKDLASISMPFDPTSNAGNDYTIRIYTGPNPIWTAGNNGTLDGASVLAYTFPTFTLGSDPTPEFIVPDLTTITLTKGQYMAWSIDGVTAGDGYKYRKSDNVNPDGPFAAGGRSDRRTFLANDERDFTLWEVRTRCGTGTLFEVNSTDGIVASVPITSETGTPLDLVGGNGIVRVDGLQTLTAVDYALISDIPSLIGFVSNPMLSTLACGGFSLTGAGLFSGSSLTLSGGNLSIANGTRFLHSGTENYFTPREVGIDLGIPNAVLGTQRWNGVYANTLDLTGGIDCTTLDLTNDLNIGGDVTSHIVPGASLTYNMGSASRLYDNVYSGTTRTGTVTATGSTLILTASSYVTINPGNDVTLSPSDDVWLSPGDDIRLLPGGGITHISGVLLPTTDLGINIGSNSLRVSNTYTNRTVTRTIDGNGASIESADNFNPQSGNVQRLGEGVSADRWHQLYLANAGPDIASDRTLKKDFLDVSADASWELLGALPPVVSYNWIDSYCEGDACRHVSWIAQDVEAAIGGIDTNVNDELVSCQKDSDGVGIDGTYGLVTGSLIPHLVNTIKDLKLMITAQATTISNQGTALTAMLNLITSLSERIDTLEP